MLFDDPAGRTVAVRPIPSTVRQVFANWARTWANTVSWRRKSIKLAWRRPKHPQVGAMAALGAELAVPRGVRIFLSPPRDRRLWIAIARIVANLVVAALLFFWCGLGLPPIALVLPLGAVVLARCRLPWLWNLAALLLLPSAFAFCWGSCCYWLGCARLHGMGLHRNFIGIGADPELRVQHTTGGCLVSGGEWLVTAPNNFGIYIHTKAFGYMRGTYRGPWPTVEEARSALLHGQPVAPRDLAAGAVTIDGRTFKLDASARNLAQDLTKHDVCADDGCITGAVSTGGSLVLGFSDFEGKDLAAIVPIGDAGPYQGHPLGWYRGPSVSGSSAVPRSRH